VNHPPEKRPARGAGETERVTSEVADEGGSPGDVELDIDRLPSRGSEGGETARPAEERTEVFRDDTGTGRRSP
jgi:hypothetical protein